ncbi:MAG: hypothetical protein ACAI37_07910 [Chthoniobacter sp.]
MCDGALAADEAKENFAATAELQRRKALKDMDQQQTERERDPAYIEEQKKRETERAEATAKAQADRTAMLAKIRHSGHHVQARVLTVGDHYVIAMIRVRILTGKTSTGAERSSYSEPMEEPCWIQDVDTTNVIDSERLELTVYAAGKTSYRAVSGAHKTVLRLSTTPEGALKAMMSSP